MGVDPSHTTEILGRADAEKGMPWVNLAEGCQNPTGGETPTPDRRRQDDDDDDACGLHRRPHGARKRRRRRKKELKKKEEKESGRWEEEGRSERAKRRGRRRGRKGEAAGVVSFAGAKGYPRRMETDGSRNGRSFCCAREAAFATQVLRGIHEHMRATTHAQEKNFEAMLGVWERKGVG